MQSSQDNSRLETKIGHVKFCFLLFCLPFLCLPLFAVKYSSHCDLERIKTKPQATLDSAPWWYIQGMLSYICTTANNG